MMFNASIMQWPTGGRWCLSLTTSVCMHGHDGDESKMLRIFENEKRLPVFHVPDLYTIRAKCLCITF